MVVLRIWSLMINSIKEIKLYSMYNIVYKGVILNKKPLTKEKAENEISLIIITYGYKPSLIPNNVIFEGESHYLSI